MMTVLELVIVGGATVFGVAYAVLRLFKWRREVRLLRTVTSVGRGTRSERRLILELLKAGFKPSALFHDLYVETSPGRYSQVDAVLATRVGIVAFEVKEYSGWLSGRGDQRHWTQVLAYGNAKYRFYNPVLQNRAHFVALRDKLKECAVVPYFSVVVFYGGCTLMNVSQIPPATFIAYPDEVVSILSRLLQNEPPAEYADKWGVVSLLREAVRNGDSEAVRLRHIENIRADFASPN